MYRTCSNKLLGKAVKIYGKSCESYSLDLPRIKVQKIFNFIKSEFLLDIPYLPVQCSIGYSIKYSPTKNKETPSKFSSSIIKKRNKDHSHSKRMIATRCEKKPKIWRNVPSSAKPGKDAAWYPFLNPWEDLESNCLHQHLWFLAICTAHVVWFFLSGCQEVIDGTSTVLHLSFSPSFPPIWWLLTANMSVPKKILESK